MFYLQKKKRSCQPYSLDQADCHFIPMGQKCFSILNHHWKIILGNSTISNKVFHQTIQAKDGIKESSVLSKLQEIKQIWFIPVQTLKKMSPAIYSQLPKQPFINNGILGKNNKGCRKEERDATWKNKIQISNFPFLTFPFGVLLNQYHIINILSNTIVRCPK